MSTTASRGTIALVSTRILYFGLGYLTVVVLARELGPVAYGVYGVIMSVLVWLEGSGRQAVPFAVAKLISETDDAPVELARSSLILNLLLHTTVFLVFWLIAPLLEIWFKIENGTYLFRLAALDLPLYGAYTALHGIYQGQRRFYRLGLSDVTYALAKLLGVLFIVLLGVSVEKALIVNIMATVAGIAFLATRTAFGWEAGWRAHSTAIFAIAAPTALYSITRLVATSLHVWLLAAMSPAGAATVGVYVAALNIARVPGFSLSTVSEVLLPSVSRATAADNYALIRHYISQALRFFLILYLPICLVLFVRPEGLMQWIYSSRYAGGGVMLVLLTIAHGFWAVQAILGAVLVAIGRARSLGALTALTMVLHVPVLVILIHAAGALGAATAIVLVALSNVIAFATLLWREFGAILNLQTMRRIAMAATLMVTVSALISSLGGGVAAVIAAGLLAYAAALTLLAEIRLEDFAAVLARTTPE